MRLDVTLDRVQIEYVFVGIVAQSKTCHIYEVVLLIIYVAAHNSSRAMNPIA
jgi:hypothetical protein